MLGKVWKVELEKFWGETVPITGLAVLGRDTRVGWTVAVGVVVAVVTRTVLYRPEVRPGGWWGGWGGYLLLGGSRAGPFTPAVMIVRAELGLST